VRDRAGNLWFDVNPGRRALGKLDVATEKFSVYQTPEDMAPLGGAVTIDIDGKGMVWASTPRGAVRFDPATEKFTEFKSAIPEQNTKGLAATYGAAGDRDGNGWWSQMAMDTVYKADIASGRRSGSRCRTSRSTACSARTAPSTRASATWLQRAAAMVPGSAAHGHRQERRPAVGVQFLRLVVRAGHTKTLETTIIPLPDPTMQAYHIAVDGRHNVWGNLWTSDRIVRYDPAANAWTVFDLPVRGTRSGTSRCSSAATSCPSWCRSTAPAR